MSLTGSPLAWAPFADDSTVCGGQALNPAAAAATDGENKDSHKRKRRHSSVTSVDEGRPASTASTKGKGKAVVEPGAENEDGRGGKGKRVRPNKQLVPVDEIMKGGNAPWQQEYACLVLSLSFSRGVCPDDG